MSKTKRYVWIGIRFCIIGPFAALAVLGEWSEEVAEYLDVALRPKE